MSPLFMETSYNSPGSVSAEDSNPAGLETEGEGQQMGDRGRKRQEKNRDAARRSRRKQTERADELHEELQGLERSNSALKKEIAALKKDLHLYMTALERHKPFCCLKASSGSTTCASVSPSADCQRGPSPPGVPPQTLSSTLAPAPSVSTSLPSSLQTRDCVEGAHLSSSTTPTTKTLASPICSSAELFTLSSPVTSPYSVSFSAVPAPHSLFSDSLITSRPTNVPPVCTSSVSNPVPSSSFAAAAEPQSAQGTINESSSIPANACFPPLHSSALDAFLMKDSFLTASSNEGHPYSQLGAQEAALVSQVCPVNVPQLQPGQFSKNPIISSPSLLPPALEDPAPQPLLVPSPASVFASPSSYSGQLNSESLLSLLTVPSPLNVSQTTSSSFDGPLSQHPPLLPTLGDPSRDLSLSELLEVNDWILSGTSHE
ncbi:flocculation protein FLO11 [Plectropomus leopardus]|uniref:flocculation protein FLO11 n=1 Tax=Plectropomus leopardus TaxID=160734 RepID=UPI001C4B38C7|nr:flocculation protein FLO11 [Plectropomus leopardus]